MPITVFVADDHAIVREGLANLLAAQPDLRVVGTAADGRDTLRQVAKLLPDVVIVEVSRAAPAAASQPHLPGMEPA